MFLRSKDEFSSAEPSRLRVSFSSFFPNVSERFPLACELTKSFSMLPERRLLRLTPTVFRVLAELGRVVHAA
jgi:hypothetical protein